MSRSNGYRRPADTQMEGRVTTITGSNRSSPVVAGVRPAQRHVLDAELVGTSSAVTEVRGQYGNLPIQAVRDARTGQSWLAVIKSPAQQGPLEVFASDFARRAGLARLVPAADRLSDGSAAIELISGTTAHRRQVSSQNALVDTLRQFHAAAPSDVSSVAATRRALHDVRSMLAFDYVLGITDRHGSNIMVQRDGDIRLIDHGAAEINRHPLTGATKTIIQNWRTYLGGAGRPVRHFTNDVGSPAIELDVGRTVQQAFSKVDHAAVRKVFDSARADFVRAGMEGRLPESYLDDVLDRLLLVARTGKVRFYI